MKNRVLRQSASLLSEIAGLMKTADLLDVFSFVTTALQTTALI